MTRTAYQRPSPSAQSKPHSLLGIRKILTVDLVNVSLPCWCRALLLDHSSYDLGVGATVSRNMSLLATPVALDVPPPRLHLLLLDLRRLLFNHRAGGYLRTRAGSSLERLPRCSWSPGCPQERSCCLLEIVVVCHQHQELAPSGDRSGSCHSGKEPRY